MARRIAFPGNSRNGGTIETARPDRILTGAMGGGALGTLPLGGTGVGLVTPAGAVSGAVAGSLALSGQAAGTLRETHVFALLGQSNMVGRADYDGLGDYPAGVQQWTQGGVLAPATSPLDHLNEYAGDMGMTISFVNDHVAAHPQADVVLVPLAEGGTGFSGGQWLPPSGSLYIGAISSLNAMFAANPTFKLKGFLWHQGESDEAAAALYADRLDSFIDLMRANVTAATETTPFVTGGIISSGGAEINTLLTQTVDRRAYSGFAPATGLTLFDGLHFDAASLRTLGQRYLVALDEAVTNTPRVPSQVTGLAAVPGDSFVALTWAKPQSHAAITDYAIEVSIAGGAYSTVADGVGTGLSFVHSALTNDVLHTYRVSAVSANGTGAASSAASATPVAAVAPSGGDVSVLAFSHGESGSLIANAYTFSGQAIAPGTVVVGVVSRGTGGGDMLPSSVTLGGTAMTLLGTKAQSTLAGSSTEAQHKMSYWGLEGVSDSLADVVITMTSGDAARCGCVLWSLANVTLTGAVTAFKAATSANTGACTATINVPAGGVLLAYGNSISTSQTILSGSTERLARTEVSTDFWHAAGDDVLPGGATGKAVTLQYGTPANRRIVGLLGVAKAV